MANTIQLKRSSVSGRIPDAANVEVGEPVINLADQILYTKDGSGTIKIIGAGTTSNIAEGTNLYFTNARAVASLTPGSGITIASNGLVSSTITAVSLGDAAGFINSTTLNFPTGNYEDLSFDLESDAFGVSLFYKYDCMEPNGRMVEEDLGVLT